MDIAYFPGCSLHGIAREYDRSARLVCERLDINLVEVEDWNCCGATAAHSLDQELTMGLSARNLSIINRMNHGAVTTPCAGCFNRLKTAGLHIEWHEFVKPHTIAGEDELEVIRKFVRAGYLGVVGA